MKHGYITQHGHNTSWIYEKIAKGLCAQAKAKCFEESKIV
jgi:hypothetical protein